MDIVNDVADSWVDELLVLVPLDQAGVFTRAFYDFVVERPIIDFDLAVGTFKEEVAQSKEQYDVLAGTLLRIASYIDAEKLKGAMDAVVKEVNTDGYFSALDLPSFNTPNAILFVLRLNFHQIILRVNMNGKDPSIRKQRRDE